MPRRRNADKPRVLDIKRAVRERDGNRCIECGMSNAEHIAAYGKQLEVHRIVPGSAYANDDSCQTLCQACHGPKPKSPWRPRGHRAIELLGFREEMVERIHALANAMCISPIGLVRMLVHLHIHEEEERFC